MRQYLRWRFGTTYFFTVVTHERKPVLTTPIGRQCLQSAILEVQQKLPFRMLAVVLLPDHIHTIWQLPHGDVDYSQRWRLIKTRFTRMWLSQHGIEGEISPSRSRKRERGVWQRRFYEHMCRDEADLERCVHYIHVNPLKHGLVNRVVDWPWSSFHRYLKLGMYTASWGSSAEWYGDEFADAE